MKKLIALLLAVILACTALVACSPDDVPDGSIPGGDGYTPGGDSSSENGDGLGLSPGGDNVAEDQDWLL